MELLTTREVVLNQTLAVASVASAVTVVETPPGVELNKTNATIERILPQEFVDAIPVGNEVGASLNSLVLLAPNASRNARGNQPPASVNGSGPFSVNFTMDGTDNNIDFLAIPAIYRAREATAAVQTQTSAYSAEFGRGLGQVSLISRSGSNRLHGELNQYYTADWMRAPLLADKRSGLTAVGYIDNTFGGTLGGPIKKDHTFFFLQGNGRTQRLGPSARGAAATTIPTESGYAALARSPLGPDQTTASRQAMLVSCVRSPVPFRATADRLPPSARPRNRMSGSG